MWIKDSNDKILMSMDQVPTTRAEEDPDVLVVDRDAGKDQTDAYNGYCRRQPIFFGWMMLISGVLTLLQIGLVAAGVLLHFHHFRYFYSVDIETPLIAIVSSDLINSIISIIMGLALLYFQVEDKGDFLLVTSGPWRWGVCGQGKEKFRYTDIRDYEITKTCFFGFGLPCCTSIKLFNSCTCCFNCCGGDMGGCCVQRTVRLTIRERMQAQDVSDTDDCPVARWTSAEALDGSAGLPGQPRAVSRKIDFSNPKLEMSIA